LTDGPEFTDVERLVARIPDGATLAISKTECGAAMAATRALIRRRVRGLRLVTLPTGGLQADLLIGAGCVAAIETSAVTLGEHGPAPCFTRAVTAGRLEVRDSTCPAVYAALQAAEKGVPFLPIRGLIGSDLLRVRDDYKVVDNPFAAGDPIVVVPALRPDVALVHAPLADRHGNVWIGRQRPQLILAHAARETLATVEEVRDGDLLADEALGPATISALYVAGVAPAKDGAWPVGLADRYDEDALHIREYCRLAASEDGFREYLERYVLSERRVAAE
jgi:glutaconate CoA-transferase subunit A